MLTANERFMYIDSFSRHELGIYYYNLYKKYISEEPIYNIQLAQHSEQPNEFLNDIEKVSDYDPLEIESSSNYGYFIYSQIKIRLQILAKWEKFESEVINLTLTEIWENEHPMN